MIEAIMVILCSLLLSGVYGLLMYKLGQRSRNPELRNALQLIDEYETANMRVRIRLKSLELQLTSILANRDTEADQAVRDLINPNKEDSPND